MRHTAIAGLLSAAVALASSGHAGTTAALHGSMCRPANNANTFVIDQYGISNSSTTQGIDVYCPIPVSVSGTLTFNKTYAVVYNRNSGTPLTCGAYVTYDDGTITGWITTGSAYGPSGSAIWLQSTGSQPTTGYYWYMKCNIPPIQGGNRSHVTTYAAYAP